MQHTLTDEQQMLRSASRDLLSDHCGPETVRSQLGADEPDPKLWSLGVSLGWTGLTVPEEFGGSAQTVRELAVVAQELGRFAARGAFLEAALAGSALARAGHTELLSEIADGSLGVTLAITDRPRTEATVELTGSTAVLHGGKTLVPEAGSAAWLLVEAVGPAGPALVLVRADEVTVQAQRTLDLTRGLFSADLEGVELPANRVVTLDPSQAQLLRDEAALLVVADALGAGERLLTMTVEYAKVREQFGRAIGSFQAVKHKCARMRLQVLASQAAVDAAAMALSAGDPSATQAVSSAKSYVCRAMSELAGEALQVHGGIGFTWEHDLHVLMRRIRLDELLHGDLAFHESRLADLLHPR